MKTTNCDVSDQKIKKAQEKKKKLASALKQNLKRRKDADKNK